MTDPIRLLALVLTAIRRAGWQHQTTPRIVGGAVEILLSGNAKRIREWMAFADVVIDALSSVGLCATISRSLVLAVEEPSPDVLAQPPSPEALGMLISSALRSKLEESNVGEDVRVFGSQHSDGGYLEIRGGIGDGPDHVNARATAFARAWIEKHFPEFAVEEGREPVSKLTVWHTGVVVHRALRVRAREATKPKAA